MAKHLIIAGHGRQPSGRYDPGACANNYTEAGLIRDYLIPAMKKYSKDIAYITDRDVYAYGNITSYRNYKTITELHFNAAAGNAYGAEVLIKAGFTPDSLDKKLLSVLAKHFYNRGFKYRNNIANINRTASAGINYRLVETCFITSKSDLNIFFKNLDSIAKGFVEAIEGRTVATNRPKEVPVVKDETKHWAYQEVVRFNKYARDLDFKGLSELRLDDPISRGEAITLFNRVLSVIERNLK